MKIVVYLWTYPPFRFTGGELMTADLLTHLVKSGHTVDVYVKNLYNDTPYKWNGVSVRSADELSDWMSLRYDVFITHPEIRTDAIRYMTGMPYIGIVHNTSVLTMRSLERQPPHLTVVNSEDTRQHVPETAVRFGKGVVIVNPPVLIDTSPVDTDTPRRFVTQINLSHEKGGAVFRHLALEYPETPFLGVIGGHGVQVDGLPANVTIQTPTTQMRNVYAKTKVLVFPTKRESYGKVAAEAMQFGVPMIVSDLPALHEVCGDAAMYVDPHDYAAWKAALRDMLEPDTLARYAELSQERGKALRSASYEALNRWETLVREVAGR